MTRIWTIIGVADVARSLGWYQALLGMAATAPAHAEFGRLVDADGTVLLCLHAWEAHGHPSLMAPGEVGPGEVGPGEVGPGNGLLLFFWVEDFDAALTRARGLGGGLVEEPQVNANTGAAAFSLRDPDGYYVTISALEAG